MTTARIIFEVPKSGTPVLHVYNDGNPILVEDAVPTDFELNPVGDGSYRLQPTEQGSVFPQYRTTIVSNCDAMIEDDTHIAIHNLLDNGFITITVD